MAHIARVRLDPHRPFSPARLPFFYGWVVMVVSTIGLLVSIPGQTMIMSVFADRFIAAAEISRTQLSDAYMLGTAISALLVSSAGSLYDRLGARFFFMFSTVLFGFAVMGMSQIDRVALWVVELTDGSAVARAAVFVGGFFLIRFLGQGMVTIGARSMLSKWFDRLRGRVISISGLFVAAFFSIAPVWLNAQVEAVGWRGSWLMNGLLLATVIPLMGYLFFRDNPEECGLKMDGPYSGGPARKRIEDMLIIRDFTRREALCTYSFWVFTFGLAAQSLFATAFTFHVADIGREAGIDTPRILSFFALSLWFTIPTNLICGYISEFVRLRYILMVLGFGGGLLGGGVLMLPSAAGEWLLIAGMGISWGTYPVLSNVTFARYFGRTHLGAISGVTMSAMVLGSAVGPAMFARVKAASGTYDPVFWVMLGIYLLVVVAALFAANPQRRLARAADRTN